MQNLKTFITQNKTILLTAYVVLSLVAITWLGITLARHECPEVKSEILIQKEYREKIKEIDSAEDRATIDSLFNELYGFSSK